MGYFKQLMSFLSRAEEVAYHFRKEDLELEEFLSAALRKKGEELCCAESCTGGYLSHLITASTAMSKYFRGGIITYSPELKESILQIDPKIVEEQRAVNEACAIAMLLGAIGLMKAKYAISITGFAGPDGGTHQNPTGTVWIAAGTVDAYLTRRYQFVTSRPQNIYLFSVAALYLLKEFMEAELASR